jgi:hypothetical protein
MQSLTPERERAGPKIAKGTAATTTTAVPTAAWASRRDDRSAYGDPKGRVEGAGYSVHFARGLGV